MANSEQLIGCEENLCRIVVYTFSLAPAEEHLSVCTVEVAKGVVGAPFACDPVILLEDGHVAWMSVIIALDFSPLRLEAYGLEDFEIVLTGDGMPSGEAIRKRIENVLTSSPWRYATTVKADQVLAIHRFSVSTFLKGYREIATVRIEVKDREIDGAPARIISVSTNLLLSRQNTGDSRDYRGASEAESDLYVAGIRAIVHDAIALWCSKEIECYERHTDS